MMKKVILFSIFFIFLSNQISSVSAELVSINAVKVNPENQKIASILIEGIDPAGVNSGIIELHYDPSIVIVIGVVDSDFNVLEPNIQNSMGYTRIVVAQSGSSLFGPGPIIFANVTLQAVGPGGESSHLNLFVKELLREGDMEVPFTVDNGAITINVIDNCKEDPNKVEPGACGCGTPDIDSDSDGIPDCIDTCPPDFDNNGTGVCSKGDILVEQIKYLGILTQDKPEVNLDNKKSSSVTGGNLPDYLISSLISKNNSDQIDNKIELIPGFSALLSFILIIILKIYSGEEL
ncbi:MAG TPA: hypothetical protein VMW53_08455 [archaeon]|nr:hypothetical protein [archaeon]